MAASSLAGLTLWRLKTLAMTELDLPDLAGDFGHVTEVRPAATAEDVKPWHLVYKSLVLTGEFLGVTVIELCCQVEFCVAHLRGIAAQTTDPFGPGFIIQRVCEVSWVRAVDHEVCRIAVGCIIYSNDGLAQGLTQRKSAISLDGKRNHNR